MEIFKKHYPLRHNIVLEFKKNKKSICCIAKELPSIIGKGSTQAESTRDWRKNFDHTFTSLWYKRPFEMSVKEKECWRQIEAVVNMAEYKSRLTVDFTQTGCLVKKNGHKCTIHWICGRRQTVCSDLFKKVKKNQWFEAQVCMTYLTCRFVKIKKIDLIKHEPPTKPELMKMWYDIPIAKLPTCSW